VGALIAGSFALGSIPFGWLVARAVSGVDIRHHGSGNIGATNVGRVVGRGWGWLVLALDAAKGAGPVLVARSMDPEAAVAAGLAAILGHVFTPWLGFRGGKGVATAAGVFAVLTPLPFTAALLAFLAMWGVTRTVGWGSLAGATTLLGATWALETAPGLRAMATAVAVLVWVRHAGNLRRALGNSRSRS
jgi:glycerol-3-phosphate acyltransferase PlsY